MGIKSYNSFQRNSDIIPDTCFIIYMFILYFRPFSCAILVGCFCSVPLNYAEKEFSGSKKFQGEPVLRVPIFLPSSGCRTPFEVNFCSVLRKQILQGRMAHNPWISCFLNYENILRLVLADFSWYLWVY